MKLTGDDAGPVSVEDGERLQQILTIRQSPAASHVQMCSQCANVR